MEPFDFVISEILETKLKQQNYTTAEIADLLANADTTFLNRETQNLIKIAKLPKSKQCKLLKKHAYEYRWTRSAHMGKLNLPFSYFENELKEIAKKNLKKELKKLKESKRESNTKKTLLLNKKPVDRETKQLLKICKVVAPFHDIRKELFLRSIYTIGSVREEIGKRYGYTNDEMSIFQLEEILPLERGKKLNLDRVKLNEEGALLINNKEGIWKHYYGDGANKIYEKELLVNLHDEKEIKGMVASAGNAKGIVKVIQGTNDMEKMKKGRIIVSSMTRPEMMLALKKAAAIITDEGDVTCHAAIISRELGIPCIIGTKNATSILKDGDFVEVDANHGIVKILK